MNEIDALVLRMDESMEIDFQVNKLIGTYTWGTPVKIYWSQDAGIPPDAYDQGYIMGLPTESDPELGAIVHIPQPWVEKAAYESEWIPLAELLANTLVARVEAS